MTACDDIVQRNAQYARTAAARELPGQPALRVAIVTCMDCRINVFESLGLQPGEAHVIRNAGGAVTEDVIRSLAVSQRKLGTREVMVIHHTACGMQTFTDAEQDVRQSVERVRRSPFLSLTTEVRGFVADIVTGELVEVA